MYPCQYSYPLHNNPAGFASFTPVSDNTFAWYLKKDKYAFTLKHKSLRITVQLG